MNIHVTFRHLETSDEVREYAIEKVEKLERYFHDAIQVNVVLFKDRFNQVADITIIAKGGNVNVKEETNDIRASIDRAASKLERQLKKQKDKTKDHKAHASADVVSKIYYEKEKDSAITFGHGAPNIINTIRYDFNPMTLEDAVLSIEKKNKAFVVFNNLENNNLTILYKLANGDYGIIEPKGEPKETLVKDLRGNERKVIPQKDLYASSLTVDESIDTINKKNSSFIVFKNRTSENLNIVYKKRNGELGLIEV